MPTPSDRYVVIAYKGRLIDWIIDPMNLRAPGPMLGAWGTGVGKRNIFERIQLGADNRVALRTIVPDAETGQLAYVHADHNYSVGDGAVPHGAVRGIPWGGLFLLPMDQPGESESFLEIWRDHNVTLQTWKGLFVTAEGDGKDRLTINREVIGEWQRFHYQVPPQELLPKESPEPTIAEQATSTVDQAQTQVEGIPPNPRGTVRDAQTEMQRPAGLRDKIFRRPGE